MAYIMDSNEEERIKGITVEVRRARFETENTRFAILDAPFYQMKLSFFMQAVLQNTVGRLAPSAQEHPGQIWATAPEVLPSF
ncbi:hypothetical protein SLEP1_g53121 [Rubroshorea leprosula]|uniref:Uncharacterized protein n=1 Tax=Rubroshorea leprosula TaxID=152421 RepID=A0AAV5M9I6_9ROSI|nr:hypothetical protein SLEP1_g53121 [Rubroshorea leprosula]